MSIQCILMQGCYLQNATVNLPAETFLRGSSVTLYGGVLRGVESVIMSLGGSLIIHPQAKLDSDIPSAFNLKAIKIHDGGLLAYKGDSNNGDTLSVQLQNHLIVHGGGRVEFNSMSVTGNIFMFFTGIVSKLNYISPLSQSRDIVSSMSVRPCICVSFPDDILETVS